MKYSRAALSALILVASISGCSDNPAGVAAVATIAVTITDNELLPGETSSATAVVKDGSGATLTGRQVSWSSSNTGVVTVSQSGVVTAVSAGTASVIATSEGKTGSVQVSVKLPPVATVVVTGATRVKVGDAYTYTVTARLADGTVVNRPIAWSVLDPASASITQLGILTPLTTGVITIVVTIDGVQWTTEHLAYDWESFSSGGSHFAVLLADNKIANKFGTEDYSELIASCSSGGFFFVWVRTPHVVTANGLVAMSFDNGDPFTEMWDELSPNFNTLWKPGSNAVVKAFANQIAASRIFGFAFGEFQGSAKAMLFRVTGMGSRLPFLFSQCPSSAFVADAHETFASTQAELKALHASLVDADASPPPSAILRQQVGPEPGRFTQLVQVWPVVETSPSQQATRR